MRGLSNFFRNRDPSEQVIRPVGPGEIEPAVRLMIGNAGEPADSAAAAEFEAAAEHRKIDLARIQVAFLNEKMIAAALPVDSGGSAVLLMASPAGTSKMISLAAAGAVLASVDAWPKPSPLFQILLDTEEWKTADELRTRGFEDLATLLYMQRTLYRNAPRPELPAGISLLNDSPQNRPFFRDAILQSYEQSLDCPKLHGKRSIDDVIAAHQATGEYDPNLWYCLLDGDTPAGVLLLSRLGDQRGVELVYLGLTVAARGRGFGDLLLQLAMHEAWQQPGKTLTLAVDEQNKPALQLYQRHGLAQVHARLAMMFSH